ncbi:hypothetical protein SSX86_020853 [Deinandra increscens subsp. villosa]|uniref:F-box associated beta-propeller type 3 domain-containing protein n=1 Tax=Deinandra increscens subsp. villosa TaxID=3103831 RepID=A0AAP0GTT8_9ASTR
MGFLNDMFSSAKAFRPPVIIAGSVNGLICLYNRFVHETYVLNPIFEEYTILPKPRPKNNTEVVLSCGFGVSASGKYKEHKVYKVIRICCKKVSLDPYTIKAPKIEVYTLGTGQWRSLGRENPNYHLTNLQGPLKSAGLFLNSHVYWIADDQIYDFDLVTETFELLPSPPQDIRDASYHTLAVVKGRLSRISSSTSRFSVWVMKEGSWCKLMKNVDGAAAGSEAFKTPAGVKATVALLCFDLTAAHLQSPSL